MRVVFVITLNDLVPSPLFVGKIGIEFDGLEELLRVRVNTLPSSNEI